MGINYNLHLQIRSNAATTINDVQSTLNDARVYALEFGSPSKADDAYSNVGGGEGTAVVMAPIFFKERREITAEFQDYIRTPTAGPFISSLSFAPPGFMHYWGVCITIDIRGPGVYAAALGRLSVTGQLS
jgi:hypothetical protein